MWLILAVTYSLLFLSNKKPIDIKSIELLELEKHEDHVCYHLIPPGWCQDTTILSKALVLYSALGHVALINNWISVAS